MLRARMANTEAAAPSAVARRKAAAAGRQKTSRRAAGGKSESTRQLEAIVFGGLNFDDGQEAAAEEEDEADVLAKPDDIETEVTADGGASARKRRKRTASDASHVSNASSAPAEMSSAAAPKAEGGAAWVDADDATLTVDLKAQNRRKKLRTNYAEVEIKGDEYEKRLRQQFSKMNGIAHWADPAARRRVAWADSSDEEGGPNIVPSSAKHVLEKDTSGRLRPTEIDVERLKEVPLAEEGKKGKAVIQAVDFHPNSELLLTAGMDKTLRLFAVDGEENPKVSSHFFKGFPIMGAKFLPGGDQIVMTGFDQRMFGLDVKTGQSFRVKNFDSQCYRRFVGPFVSPCPQAGGSRSLRSSGLYAVLADGGAVLLCDARTKLPVRTLRMSSLGASAVFSADREALYTADQESHIYDWDLGTGRCKQRVQDTHSGRITTLALSRITANAPSPVLAVGTMSGNVDLFDAGAPKLSEAPFKSIDNLTTRISGVHFHPEGELLAEFSQFKKLSLRLVHMGTKTVYSNWPPLKSPMGRVSAFDFSPKGGYMAVGNETGRVLLYRLRHYEQG